MIKIEEEIVESEIAMAFLFVCACDEETLFAYHLRINLQMMTISIVPAHTVFAHRTNTHTH